MKGKILSIVAALSMFSRDSYTLQQYRQDDKPNPIFFPKHGKKKYYHKGKRK